MSRTRFFVKFVPLLAVALVLFSATSVMACPNCKDALASLDGDQSNLITGFFWSILFMMSMPFVILGTFGFCMYRAVNKARNEQTAVEAESELVEV